MYGSFDFVPKIVLIIQTLLVGLIVLGLYYGISTYLFFRRNKKLLAGVKGPKECHWLFGSFPYIPKDMHDRTMYFVEICNKYGTEQGFVLLWAFLGRPLIVTCSQDVMAQILKSSVPKARGFMGIYRFLLPWLGEGLLTAGGSKWARNRRLLTPAFHFEILKPYTNVFNRSSDTLVEKITKEAEDGKRFEVFTNVCLCTLEIILKCAFSYDKDVQNMGSSYPYIRSVNRLSDAIMHRLVNPVLYFDFIWSISKTGRQFKKDCEYVHVVADEIIDKRRQSLSKQESPSESRYVDFLDILLTAKDEEGKGLSRMEIRNEVDTFLFEGHDTTASAISWILYSLAGHPQCQKKCQEEIDALLEGRDSSDLEWSDLSKLEYLTMCIKEGMRLHSPVPLIGRQITKDFELGDKTIPVGSVIQLNIWAYHHMENIWGADHMEFKPERFSTDNSAKMQAFQYLPFSAGSSFTFRLDPDHEVRKSLSMVMRAQNGMFMFAEKRQH